MDINRNTESSTPVQTVNMRALNGQECLAMKKQGVNYLLHAQQLLNAAGYELMYVVANLREPIEARGAVVEVGASTASMEYVMSTHAPSLLKKVVDLEEVTLDNVVEKIDKESQHGPGNGGESSSNGTALIKKVLTDMRAAYGPVGDHFDVSRATSRQIAGAINNYYTEGYRVSPMIVKYLTQTLKDQDNPLDWSSSVSSESRYFCSPIVPGKHDQKRKGRLSPHLMKIYLPSTAQVREGQQTRGRLRGLANVGRKRKNRSSRSTASSPSPAAIAQAANPYVVNPLHSEPAIAQHSENGSPNMGGRRPTVQDPSD